MSSIHEESASDISENSAPSTDDSQGTSQQPLFHDDPCISKQVIYEIDQDTDTSCATRSDHGPQPASDSFDPPADHPPSVFAVRNTDPDQFTLPEHGPDLVGGNVSVDPASFTTRVALHCGPYATTRAKCVSLLDSGSPQTFIKESMWTHMKKIGAASDVCEVTTQPRVWGGFGDSSTPLTTQKSVRLSVQFFHNDSRSASLAVWAFIVPDGTMHHALLLGRDSYMRFDRRTYRTLPPLTPQSAPRGELQLQHFGTLSGALAYKKNEHATGAAYHLRYHGTVGVTLSDEPQLLQVSLVRRNGMPALTGHYLAELLPKVAAPAGTEHFVSEGEQLLPLTGHANL